MTDSRPWTLPLCALLEQGAELVASLEPDVFTQTGRLAPQGSVGAHMRHVADFVQSFLRDLARGAVDYDRRERDERLERDPVRARAHLLRLRDGVLELGRLDPRGALEVRAESALVGQAWQPSSLARELVVLLSHTVHHYALIAVLLRARGIEPPPELGVAPSTLGHWQEERSTCAPRAG